MHEQMWMMRDDNSGGYAYNDDRSSEQGYYIWWDKSLWKKVRRAYTLRYADLDDMPNVAAGGVGVPGAQGQQGIAQGFVGVGARPGGIGAAAMGAGRGGGFGGALGSTGLNAGAAAAGGSAAGVGGGAFNAVPGLERLAAAGRGF